MMKTLYFTLIGFLLPVYASYSQQVVSIDLHKAVKDNTIEVFNRKLTLVNEPSHSGIRLSKAEGEGIAWLKGIQFSNGTIEFDVHGEDVKQHSFVGIAFHGKDNETFDAIYLRPFQFKATEEVLRNRAIQYISLPDFTWRTLREKFPGKYESAINPAPEPNGWVKVRIEIKDGMVTTYINGNANPSLVVKKVTGVSAGRIGFYVADTSGGEFANITITKTD